MKNKGINASADLFALDSSNQEPLALIHRRRVLEADRWAGSDACDVGANTYDNQPLICAILGILGDGTAKSYSRVEALIRRPDLIVCRWCASAGPPGSLKLNRPHRPVCCCWSM